MNDLLPSERQWRQVLTARRLGGPDESVSSHPPALRVLRTVQPYVPPIWLSFARRGFWHLSANLPKTLRARLHSLAGLMRPDTTAVEEAYPDWIARHDRLDDRMRRRILARIANFASPPLISVIMPTFNPDPAHLSAAIRSVEQQLYPHWQLCIADDASTNPAIAPMLREAEARDSRISVIWRESNGHISTASNSALSRATGAFVALLDHDDLLPPRALYEVAARILEQPDVDILYSDEDHVDEAGRRSHPYFKPGWNPDLMLGHNLISHLGVYRRSLVDRIGGFRVGYEGSQDYDLALRAVAQTRAERIVHIPHVLYHWRQDGIDRTFSQASHDRCVRNGRRAVQDFIDRQQPGATAVPAPALPTFSRVIHPVPADLPLVSVIITAGGDADAVMRCRDRLPGRTDYANVEILVAGRGADDVAGSGADNVAGGGAGALDWITAASRRPPSVNVAAETAQGSLILLLNPDVEPSDAGWLREMVSQAIRPGVGAVGAKLLNSDGTIRHAGITVGGGRIARYQFPGRQRSDPGYFGHLHLVRSVTAVSSACLMVRRETFLLAGGLLGDPPLAHFSDVDLCLRLIDKGYRNVWTPYAELTWRPRPDRTKGDSVLVQRAAALMRERWGRRLDADAYWNPNLSADHARLSLVARHRAAGKAAVNVG